MFNDKIIDINDKRICQSFKPLPPPKMAAPGGILEMSPGETVMLTIENMRRADKGTYQLIMNNELGQTTSSCQVEVIGMYLLDYKQICLFM